MIVGPGDRWPLSRNMQATKAGRRVGMGIANVYSPGSAWCGGGHSERDQEMGIVRIVDRKCATCEYWKGQREINRVNRREVSHADGMQGCELKPAKVSGRASCPKYKKWVHLP